jgi:hypothetical protein
MYFHALFFFSAARYDPVYPGMENRVHGGGAAYFPEQSNKVATEIGSKVVVPCKILNLTNESVSFFHTLSTYKCLKGLYPSI